MIHIDSALRPTLLWHKL